MLLIRLSWICQCCMTYHHDTQNTFERKDGALTLTRNFKIHRYEIMQWYYVMILWVILLFLFWTMSCSFKGPCNIKSFKISTAYDVWFSRYRPLNLMIGAGVHKLIVGSATVTIIRWQKYVIYANTLVDGGPMGCIARHGFYILSKLFRTRSLFL